MGIGDFLKAAVGGVQVSGAAAEYAASCGVPAVGHLPMAIFARSAPTVETRAITPGPAVDGALQPTVPFVFERSAAASLGIMMPQIPSGQAQIPKITTAVPADTLAKDGAAPSTAAAVTLVNQAPVRIAGQFEVRGYTEATLLDQFSRAVAGNVRHGALGGLQCAAGAVARAFAAAEVDGDAEGLLDPTTLYQMGFDLVREGQTVWLLEAGTGRLRLTRASMGTDVYHGGPASETWLYQVTMPGPSTSTTVRASADQVIHIRQNSDPTCPWRGRSGLAVAQSSGAWRRPWYAGSQPRARSRA